MKKILILWAVFLSAMVYLLFWNSKAAESLSDECLVTDKSEYTMTGYEDTLAIINYKCDWNIIKLPEFINNKPVVEIWANAFDRKWLARVELPSTLQRIWNFAFRWNRLEEVIIPDSVISMWWDAFEGNNLRNVKLSKGLKTIGGADFANNYLTTIEIPEWVTIIWDRAFKNNKLRELVIPKNVKTIQYEAFNFNNLSTVAVLWDLESVDYSSFCNNEQEIVVWLNVNQNKEYPDACFKLNKYEEQEEDSLLSDDKIEKIEEDVVDDKYADMDEKHRAYYWAYENEITTQNSYENADIDWYITRQAAAKMIVTFSVNVLWKRIDSSVKCEFDDENEVKPDLSEYVQKACQLWLMWKWSKTFNPQWLLTRAQFWTILSRILWGELYNTAWENEPYYLPHLTALQENWIMWNITRATEVYEKRGNVMVMLMRSKNIYEKPLYSSRKQLIASNKSENIKVSDLDYDAGYKYLSDKFLSWFVLNNELETLLDESWLSEEEKQSFRENEFSKNFWFIARFAVLISDISSNFELTDINEYNKKIEILEELKDLFNDYVSYEYEKYELLGIDVADKTPSSIWEKLSEKREYFSNLVSKISKVQEVLEYWKTSILENNLSEISDSFFDNKNSEEDILNNMQWIYQELINTKDVLLESWNENETWDIEDDVYEMLFNML